MKHWIAQHKQYKESGFTDISVKCPTSGGQTHDQVVAIQLTFHLERHTSLPSNTESKGLDEALLARVLHIPALNADPNFCPPELNPYPIKTYLLTM